MTHERALDDKAAKLSKPSTTRAPHKRQTGDAEAETPSLIRLQHHVGNQAVQRLLAQRSGDGAASASLSTSFDLDDETAGRINQARCGGQALDSAVQKQASAAMGRDLSDVRVHTSPEADDLSRQLGASAFTTGQDIFFRGGAYDPGSTNGQELIGHELTHVVQQSSGAVGSGGGRMTVNAPGDAFEQEADAVAKTVASPEAATALQRQVIPEEEEEEIQLQIEEEEEEPVQMQELDEQEEDEVM